MKNLKIDGISVRLKPLKVKGIKFDKNENGKRLYVDSQGNELQKVAVSKGEYKFVRKDTGKEHKGKHYKAINGKPVKPFSKTESVKSVEISPSEKQFFIKNDRTYLVIGDALKAKLQESGKALKFKYVNRGFKVYKAVVDYNSELDKVLMRCYRGDLRKLDLNDDEGSEEKQESDDEGVESLNMNDIEV